MKHAPIGKRHTKLGRRGKHPRHGHARRRRGAVGPGHSLTATSFSKLAMVPGPALQTYLHALPPAKTDATAERFSQICPRKGLCAGLGATAPGVRLGCPPSLPTTTAAGLARPRAIVPEPRASPAASYCNATVPSRWMGWVSRLCNLFAFSRSRSFLGSRATLATKRSFLAGILHSL